MNRRIKKLFISSSKRSAVVAVQSSSSDASGAAIATSTSHVVSDSSTTLDVVVFPVEGAMKKTNTGRVETAIACATTALEHLKEISEAAGPAAPIMKAVCGAVINVLNTIEVCLCPFPPYDGSNDTKLDYEK